MKRTLMAITGLMLAGVIAIAIACGDDADSGNKGANDETPGAATAATGSQPMITGGPRATAAAIESLEPDERSTVVYGTAVARNTSEAEKDATEEAEEAAEDAEEETHEAREDATMEARERENEESESE